jgi:non-canonical poly(A) RNA polymerase PAPD5/7
MDLVLHGEYFQRTGRPDLCQRRKELWAFYGDLQRANIARPGSLVCIATAKVPIIKFVDYLTGLSVDLSFDSSTGTDVVEMYHHWQRQYPALPILASVIKQFLMMRSLNDVATGGLGGYSVICLVVSFLQHCPPERHEQHGELLLEFLDFYGNKFDRTANYISLDPPGYFPKVCS